MFMFQSPLWYMLLYMCKYISKNSKNFKYFWHKAFTVKDTCPSLMCVCWESCGNVKAEILFPLFSVVKLSNI